MPSYLRRRGHTWFLRWKWPSRLAARGFSGELIRSLRTSDFHIARRRAFMLVLKIEAMSSSNNVLNRAELESAVRGWIDDCVWRQEIKRAETGGLDFLECHEIEKIGRADATELDGLFRFASNIFAPQEKAAIGRVLTGDEPNDRYRPIITEAARQIGMAAESGYAARSAGGADHSTRLCNLARRIAADNFRDPARHDRGKEARAARYVYFHRVLGRFRAAQKG